MRFDAPTGLTDDEGVLQDTRFEWKPCAKMNGSGWNAQGGDRRGRSPRAVQRWCNSAHPSIMPRNEPMASAPLRGGPSGQVPLQFGPFRPSEVAALLTSARHAHTLNGPARARATVTDARKIGAQLRVDREQKEWLDTPARSQRLRLSRTTFDAQRRTSKPSRRAARIASRHVRRHCSSWQRRCLAQADTVDRGKALVFAVRATT